MSKLGFWDTLFLSVFLFVISLAAGMIGSRFLIFKYCDLTTTQAVLSEDTCSNLRGVYGNEYLCTDNNKLEADLCWFEEFQNVSRRD